MKIKGLTMPFKHDCRHAKTFNRIPCPQTYIEISCQKYMFLEE